MPIRTRTGFGPSASQAVGANPSTSGPIARLLAADMATTGDKAFTFLITPTLWVPRRIISRRASGAYGVACLGGIWTGASATGSNVVLATQSFLGLAGANDAIDLAMIALATVKPLTAASLYLNVATANTGALTADFYVYGDVFG